MTYEEIIALIAESRPSAIYISGKTSTGKSTLANQIAATLDYAHIEFDEIVIESIIKPFSVPEHDHSKAFISAYRDSESSEQRNAFIRSAKEKVGQLHKEKNIVSEGAIANPGMLKQIFDSIADFMFVYIHPVNLDVYEQRLTERFMKGAGQGNAGLPKAFWDLVDDKSLSDFRQSKSMNPDIIYALHQFAISSQLESGERLNDMKKEFQDICLVEI